jgi:uncharacterized protein (TIGR00369 family)
MARRRSDRFNRRGGDISYPLSRRERHYTHGGILATIIDMAADYAIMAWAGMAVPTIDIRVDYHRAAIKCDMIAKARVVKLGRVYSTAEAEVYNPEGKMLASGRGTFLTNVIKDN